MESVVLQSEISMSVVTSDEHGLLADNEDRPLRWHRCVGWVRIITANKCGINAEPMVLLSAISYGIYLSVAPLFLFWARCVEIFGGYSDRQNATEFCARISVESETVSLNVVEKDISEMSVYIQLCGTIASLIGAPIIGAWSDYNGRKTPLLLSVFALTIYTLIQWLAIFVYDRMNIYYLLFAAELFVGCLGGVGMTAIVSSAIVVDDSRKELALSGIPWRITLACTGRCVGNVFGSYIYSLFAVPITVSSEHHIDGFIRTYFIAFLCCILALLYSIFFVHETHNVREVNIDGEELSFIRNLQHYSLDTFQILFTPRVGWTRLCLCLVICFMFVDFINLDNSLQLLYFKRPLFSWTDELFDKYLVLKNILTALGVTILPFSLKLLSCAGKESILLMAALFANTASSMLISAANSTEIIFIGALLFFVGSGTIPGFQTVMSKMVAKEETARMFALMSILLVVCPLFSKAVLYRIYALTLSTYPGFVFLLMAIIIFITLLGQTLVHYLMHDQWSQDEFRPSDEVAGRNSEQSTNTSTVAITSISEDI